MGVYEPDFIPGAGTDRRTEGAGQKSGTDYGDFLPGGTSDVDPADLYHNCGGGGSDSAVLVRDQRENRRKTLCSVIFALFPDTADPVRNLFDDSSGLFLVLAHPAV